MMPGLSVSAAAPRVAPRPSARLRLEPIHATHPARAGFEAFVAARFRLAYGAQITHFLPHLLGVRDRAAEWQMGAGYGAAAAQPLFLERYLDGPVERAIAAMARQPVARSQIVEVGNLASRSTGMARALIPALALHLHRLGYSWVAFTATRALRNTFHRVGLRPLTLASADPARLDDGGASWGTYYAHDPVVVACRITHGLPAWSRA